MSRTRSRPQRAVDALLGVSRRRRRLAYVAIIGGLGALRPMLWRIAGTSTVVLLTARLL